MEHHAAPSARPRQSHWHPPRPGQIASASFAVVLTGTGLGLVLGGLSGYGWLCVSIGVGILWAVGTGYWSEMPLKP